MLADPNSLSTLGRLTFRLVVVAVFAALWPSGDKVFYTALLCGGLGAECAMAALALEERWNGASLNRWHEAIFLMVIAALLIAWNQLGFR